MILKIGNPVEVQITASPHDYLNEFTEFETGLKWFCHDYNHHILIEIGEQISNELLLFPHFLASLETGFLEYIAKPIPGEIQYFDYDLVGFSLIYYEDKVVFGLKEKKYEINPFNCIKKLRNFTDGIFNTAIEKGYFTAEDVKERFDWKPQSSIVLKLEKFSGTSPFFSSKSPFD